MTRRLDVFIAGVFGALIALALNVTPRVSTSKAASMMWHAVIGGSSEANTGLHEALITNAAPSDSAANGFAANHLRCNADNQDILSGSFAECLQVEQYFGGRTMRGGRFTISAGGYLSAPTSSNNPNRNYVGVVGDMEATSSDNGTLQSPAGAVFGSNLIAHAKTGAMYLLEVASSEANFGIQKGGSARYKWGISIVATDDHTHADLEEAYLSMGAQSGSIGLHYGVNVTDQNGQFPISPDGTILHANSGRVGNAIDFSAVSIAENGFLLKGPGGAGMTGGGELRLGRGGFSELGMSPDGAVRYCSDCLKPIERSGTGTGMVVVASRSRWFDLMGNPARH